MSDRILRKAIDRIGNMPAGEIRRLVVRQLEKSDMLELLMENDNVGHCVLSDGLIVYANVLFGTLLPTNRVYLGRSEGHSLDEIITDPEVLDHLGSLNGQTEEGEEDFYFQQGSEVRIIRVSNRSIQSAGRQLVDIAVRDVTQQERDKARLRRSESLASMTTMAAGIAHEIKNPLAAMQIHLQLLKKAFAKKGSLTLDDAQRYISVLDEEIEHLNKIAVDFLFAVRPMDVKLKKQRLEPILRSLEDFVRPELEDHGITLVVDIDPFLPRLMLDENFLRQALLNIVKNAMNAMTSGGRLTIRASGQGDFVRISITDTGCGIDQEHLGKIFEPYFTTKATGTGLGLTVVYKIIKQHDGDISVESTVGQGTVFTISLPVPSDERAVLEEGGDDGDDSDS